MSDLRKMLEGCATSKERKILLKQFRQHLITESKKYSANQVTEIPIPAKFEGNPKSPFKVFRTKDYLIQVYKETTGHIRISVNKIMVTDTGDWEEDIPWDTLMWVKRKIGYGDYHAVEVYPKDDDVVNVANIRHLFVLDEPLPFIWRERSRERD